MHSLEPASMSSCAFSLGTLVTITRRRSLSREKNTRLSEHVSSAGYTSSLSLDRPSPPLDDGGLCALPKSPKGRGLETEGR